jgi:hypothetical protein
MEGLEMSRLRTACAAITITLVCWALWAAQGHP